MALAGRIATRFNAFDIPVVELDTSDVLEVWRAAGAQVEAVRSAIRPHALLLHTFRFGPHSKGDDTRPAEEIIEMRRMRDPLAIHTARLEQSARCSIEQDIDHEIASALQQALTDPFPALTP